MTPRSLANEARRQFVAYFGHPPTVAAHAPGRIEVLGNHTDYNEGFVLSAAIDLGTVFLAAPAKGPGCRLLAADMMEEATFDIRNPTVSRDKTWSNYVKGVAAGLGKLKLFRRGFNGLILGNIPLGAGLSSSAALEIATGLALTDLHRIRVDPLTLARIGQTAEHKFVGAKCGLLDQISSLYGRKGGLIMSDFRSLEVRNLRLGTDACFLMCNTRVKHSLVDSEYNTRRAHCEEAATRLARLIDHPVKALRDVNWSEFQNLRRKLPAVVARRAAHVIGENTRVLEGRKLLAKDDLAGFGRLMFESHESSRTNFQNSCRELDFVVATARKLPGVLGARLSGGGFGGSAVLLVHPRDAEVIGHALSTAYRRRFGHPCETRIILPSAGARVL